MSESSTDLEATITEIVADRCDVEQTSLTDTTRFDGELLDADSLDIVEMVEAIDANLGVFIPDEDLEDLETVGDMKTYVREAL